MCSTKKILVTGSTGFIGSAISDKLEEEGYQVTRTTRVESQMCDKDFLYLDLSKPETILGLVGKYRFDVIVHFGAYVGLFDEKEAELFLPNVIATGLLANVAYTTGSLIIFSSSVAVCGTREEAITQTSQIAPDTAYGKSKWLAEELVRTSGARNCILRIAGVFGLNGPSHLGLNRAITGAINKTTPQLNGNGNARRNYIYLWDVAEAVVTITRNSIQGTHLLAGSEECSMRLMLDNICEVFVPENSINILPGKDTMDQIIIPSSELPKTRIFKSSLKDIRDRVSSK